MPGSNSSDVQRYDRDDGTSVLAVPFDDESALSSLTQQLRSNVTTPTAESSEGDGDGGPVRRITDRRTKFGISVIRTVGMQTHELSDAVRKRRDELYRNDFPVIEPRFAVACEDCGTEYADGVDECEACGSTSLRKPDPEEKREAEALFESVNREGQSLRELMKYCEPDQWYAGVSTIVIQYDYVIAQGSKLYDDGTVLAKEPQELVYGDPARIRPVVDEHGRVGNHWYTCPLHRSDPSTDPGTCKKCGADLQPVYFADTTADDTKYYFRDEILTWAFPQPRLHGLDGLAPTGGVVLRQVVLEMMVRYGAAFFDQEKDRLPNQFMILHTANPDHWEEQINRIRDDDDDYDSPILSNETNPRNNTVPEVQVVDAMPDEMLGQSEAIKQDYKQDIRQAVGISNIHDSDLKDAGGLNNEGLQLEVTDRSIASQQKDYREGPLDALCKRLGIDDWRISFIPARDEDEDPLGRQRRIRAGQLAAESGLEARWQDGDLHIPDGEFEPPAEGAPKTESDPTESMGAGTPEPAASEDTLGAGMFTGEAATQALDEAFEHIVWADLDGGVAQQADPYWSKDEDVPANVERHITTAIARTDLTMADDAPASTLQPFFREKLTQPQGWSLQSLTRDLAQRGDLDTDYAQTVVRSAVARILNHAKYQAYAELEAGSDEEIRYYWDGPQDADTSAGCEELKRLTNPEYGGTPRPLGEFRDLQRDIHEEHYPGLEFDDSALHPSERHTIKATPASAV